LCTIEDCLLAFEPCDVNHDLFYPEESLKKGVVDYGAIVPQGSPQAGIGNPYQLQSLSNCFVIDSPQDSYGGILHTDQEQVQIMKRRGGVGFDISTIRPKGMLTTNAAKTTDGIGVFMERFSNTCREVAQGGRRGALMITIACNHPEIETFINIKRDKLKVTGANVSIKVSDAFMNAVENNEKFTLQWPVDVPIEQAKIVKVVNAKDIWDQIIDAAWYSAEPGIFFWNNVEKNTPPQIYNELGYKTTASNPCGEIPLSPYDSCRLQVIDLRKFVVDPWTRNAQFDFENFDKVTQVAQRLMDDLVDLELEFVDKILEKIQADPENFEIKQVEINLWNKIKNAGQNGRRTGLGQTGFADALAMLGIKYGSQESIEMTSRIYQALALGSYRSSVKMAEERGSFPVWDYELEKDHEFLNRIFSLDEDLKQRWQKFGRRNIANTTTAPVGSLSTVLRCSSGIEPVFMLGYDRRRKINANDTTSKVDFVDDLGDKWQQYTMYHHGVKDWMKATGETDVKKSPYFGGTSSDVDWETGVKIQSTAQRFVCHAISRTANLPREATHKTISDIYMNAWKSGCKGFTVYRDGCRSGVLLTGKESNNWFNKILDEELNEMIAIGEKFSSNMSGVYLSFIASAKKELNNRHNVLIDDCNHTSQIKHVLPRPKKLPCDLHRIKVMTNGESETYLVLVGLNDKVPYEMFCGLADHIMLPKKLIKGFIIKNGKKLGCTTYNLMLPIAGCDEEGIMFNDIVELFANRTYGAFSRQLSLGLRHQIPIHYIVEQLLKDKQSDMTSFNRVIARVLKTYIPDGTKVNSDKVCPECKQETLIYQEGCIKCIGEHCGFSKCG
jgi:ribonucleoside-diphosphate reductase alpha chain